MRDQGRDSNGIAKLTLNTADFKRSNQPYWA